MHPQRGANLQPLKNLAGIETVTRSLRLAHVLVFYKQVFHLLYVDGKPITAKPWHNPRSIWQHGLWLVRPWSIVHCTRRSRPGGSLVLAAHLAIVLGGRLDWRGRVVSTGTRPRGGVPEYAAPRSASSSSSSFSIRSSWQSVRGTVQIDKLDRNNLM